MDPRKVRRIQELMDRLEVLERDAYLADPDAVAVERQEILDELHRVVGPAFTLYRNGNNLHAVSLVG